MRTILTARLPRGILCPIVAALTNMVKIKGDDKMPKGYPNCEKGLGL